MTVSEMAVGIGSRALCNKEPSRILCNRKTDFVCVHRQMPRGRIKLFKLNCNKHYYPGEFCHLKEYIQHKMSGWGLGSSRMVLYRGRIPECDVNINHGNLGVAGCSFSL